MAVFSLLKNPAQYVPCSREDMLVDVEYREYWLAYFQQHFELIVKLAVENYGSGAEASARKCQRALVAELQALKSDPAKYGTLDLLTLDMLRQKLLISHGIPDPFEKTKSRENAAMLKLYPQIVAELDSHTSDREELLLLIEGMFAGNIFDLGAGATAKLYANSSPDFIEVRDRLGGKRPWLYDSFDSLADRILNGPQHNKCIFFLDNAGSDCILGVIPFARWLAKRGTNVRLAANDLPALNDMTYRELLAVLEALTVIDPVLQKMLASGRIAAVNSGGVAPLIDLRSVSDVCNAEARDADLVFLEGMGRGLESNFEAAFNVDAVKICMIKEQIVAERHGGKVFDCVLRFDPVA